jgi:pimeloyl-ACP methyl ester carboxylesterase
LKRVPLLAVRGAKSRILSEETLSRMAEEMPHMDHVTVAGVGHPPALDEPEVLDAIDALLCKT